MSRNATSIVLSIILIVIVIVLSLLLHIPFGGNSIVILHH